MSTSPDAETYAGTVTELDVGNHSGSRPRLEFKLTPVKNGAKAQAFIVEPSMRPEVFSAMAAVLTAAYVAKLVITVTCLPKSVDGAPVAVNIKLGSPAGEGQSGRFGFV